MFKSINNDASDQKVTLICFALAAAVLIIDSFIPLGVAGGVPYILVVLVSLWSPGIKLTVYMAILSSILTIVGFYTSPPGGEFWKVMLNRSLALFAIWTTAILCIQRKNIHDQKEEALHELKILSGLLPVCASCKKIRDDKGYWSKIETYISNHSEAKFSHGICPPCAKKLYPGLDLSDYK